MVRASRVVVSLIPTLLHRWCRVGVCRRNYLCFVLSDEDRFTREIPSSLALTVPIQRQGQVRKLLLLRFKFADFGLSCGLLIAKLSTATSRCRVVLSSLLLRLPLGRYCLCSRAISLIECC